MPSLTAKQGAQVKYMKKNPSLTISLSQKSHLKTIL